LKVASWILVPTLLASALAAEELPLRGRVVSDGEPVAQARVILTPMPGHYGLGAEFLGLQPQAEPVFEAETDDEGRFLLVAQGLDFWSVKVEAPGFAPFEQLFLRVVEPTRLGDFELEPAESLDILVSDAEQRPIEARLSIFRTTTAVRSTDFKLLGRRWRVASTRNPGTPFRMLATDDRGRATVDVARDDRLLVRALAPGFVAAEARVRGGGQVRLTLGEGSDRELRVVGVGGRPLPGVLIFDERAEVPLAVTDETGRAMVTWEREAALQIMLFDAEGRRGTARVEPPRLESSSQAGPAVVTATLDPPSRVAGRVIDRFTREPIVDALVWSDDLANRAHTGPTGEYELHRLVRRPWITVLAPGYVRGQSRSEADGRVPTVSLHPTVSLSGRVVDRDGAPLAGVEIDVFQDLARPTASARTSGWVSGSVLESSAEGGTFRVRGLPARMAFQLSAYREGWAESRMEVEPLEPFARRDGLYLVLEPGRRAVGSVLDEGDEPVADASVELLRRGPAEAGSGARPTGDHGRRIESKTDAAGAFAIADVAAGLYDIDIEASGYAPERVLGVEILDTDDDTRLGTFRLSPGAVVEGRVVDRDRQPVAGAEIRCSNDAALRASQAIRAMAGEPVDAVSDGQGRFTVDSQRPGAAVTLVVDSVRYIPAVVGGLTAPTSEPLEIVLRSPARVAGRVVDPEGRGVPGAHLMLVPEGLAGSGGYGGPPHRADSRSDGSFEINRVPPGRITLMASAGGLRDLRKSGLEVEEGGELTDLELVMQAGSTIVGTVLDPAGEPVVNALAFVLNSRWGRKGDRTDGDGRYRIDGLSPATASLAADHEEFPRVAREVDIELGTNVVDLVFGGGAAVNGQVRDRLGQPVAGAWVRLVREIPTRHSPSTVSHEDGSFGFPGVARGDYFVEAGRRGFAESRSEYAISVRDQPVAGVEVELGQGSTVSGLVLGLSAAELARVDVTAYGRLGSHGGEVGPGERYRVEHLAAGDWALRAAVETTGRAVIERLTVTPDEAELALDLDFSAGFALTGTVYHAGAPLQGARLGARGLSVGYGAETTTDPEGTFRLDGLEEGSYWIGLYDFTSGLRHSEEIEVDGDTTLSIELITDRLSGWVTNAYDHGPVADARIVLEPLLENQEFAARLLQPTGVSDSAGYFSLGDVSHGLYDLTVARPGYAELRRQLDVRGPQEELELELTPTEGIFFELTLGGTATVDWATAVVLDGDRPVARGTWAASERGRVRITGVPPGSYQMVIWAPGGATHSRPVLSPGDLGQIDLPAGGSVDVVVPELAGEGTVAHARLIGADGRVYRSVLGARLEDEFRLWTGYTRILGVPAGSWSVVVEAADGRSWTASATISAGEVAEVTLE
jgi:protocatechuate 3,4-dioxygenase beta subunit